MGSVLSYTCNGLGDRLLQSCADGDVVAVRQLLQEHSRLCFWHRISDGNTPLHVAAANGQVHIVVRIIETASKQRTFESQREAQAAARTVQNMLDALNSHGQSALMLACRHGRAEVVRLLLAQGAYPLLTDNAQHKTCLHYAAQVGWASCCAVLLSDTTFFRGSGHLLRNTEIRQRDGTTRKFIDLEAAMGYTALHIAASHGHLETTKVLLKFGASLTCECRSGLRTPATAVHRPPLVNRAHVTPLHIAAARRNVPMCRAMLQAHARYVASSESAVGGGQPEFDIRTIRDHYEQRPVDIAEALNCPPLAAMLNPALPLSLATAGQGHQGPLGPRPLADLAAMALRRGLTAHLQTVAKQEECSTVKLPHVTKPATAAIPESAGRGLARSSLSRLSFRILAIHANARLGAASTCPDTGSHCSPVHRTVSLPAVFAPPHAAVGGGDCGHPSLKRWLSDLDPLGSGLTGVSRRQYRGSLPDASCQSIASSCEVLGRLPSLDGLDIPDAKHAAAVTRRTSGTDPVECGICLDNTSRVAVQGCGHLLCTSCAAQLCSGQSSLPPICPFCRMTIGAFSVLRSGAPEYSALPRWL